MERIIITRHGESVAAAAGIENGDPATDKGLTERGREQARALGQAIAGDAIDLGVASQFPRAQQTAEVALAGRGLGLTVDAGLNDMRAGVFEGKTREEYHDWAHAHLFSTPLPDGESRVEVADRLCTAMEALLGRPEHTALVATHEILIGDLLNAIRGKGPDQPHEDIPYATPYHLTAEEISRGVAFLRAWLAQEGSSR